MKTAASTKEELQEKLLSNRLIIDRGYVTPCWEWTLFCRGGYGQYKIGGLNGKNVDTHRIAAFIWLDFDLNSKLNVLHKCDNKKCFNPEHIYIGTHLRNMWDKRDRNRAKRTKCKKGHPLTEDNLTKDNRGNRRCTICYKNTLRARYK